MDLILTEQILLCTNFS